VLPLAFSRSLAHLYQKKGYGGRELDCTQGYLHPGGPLHTCALHLERKNIAITDFSTTRNLEGIGELGRIRDMDEVS